MSKLKLFSRRPSALYEQSQGARHYQRRRQSINKPSAGLQERGIV